MALDLQAGTQQLNADPRVQQLLAAWKARHTTMPYPTPVDGSDDITQRSPFQILTTGELRTLGYDVPDHVVFGALVPRQGPPYWGGFGLIRDGAWDKYAYIIAGAVAAIAAYGIVASVAGAAAPGSVSGALPAGSTTAATAGGVAAAANRSAAVVAAITAALGGGARLPLGPATGYATTLAPASSYPANTWLLAGIAVAAIILATRH